jgi:methyl-accepting chemotaxis protein
MYDNSLNITVRHPDTYLRISRHKSTPRGRGARAYFVSMGESMNIFRDVKIGTRLAISFGLALFTAATIVGIGLVYFSKADSQFERMIRVNTAKIQRANDVRNSFSEITYLIGRMVTSDDGAAKEATKKRIADIRASYKQSVEELEKLEINDEGKKLIAELKEVVAKGREVNNSVIELTMAGKTAEAARRYQEATTVVDGYIDGATKIINYNKKRIEFRRDEAKRDSRMTRVVFYGLGILILLVGSALSWAITRSIATPLTRSAAHIDLMAKGDFSHPIPADLLRRGDELGALSGSMDTLNSTLGSMLKEVTSSATSVASASAQLNASADKLAQGATEQVDRAAQVAAGSTEMNAASLDIAQNFTGVATSAQDAVRVAGEGREIVDQAIREVNLIAETVETAAELVRELGDQSAKIGDIVTVITDIADQTNLLALNAAIEAARAGEHGRGFAVVADEVKKLAERTSRSTTEISRMITTIRRGVERTIDAMKDAKRLVVTGVDYSVQTRTALEGIIAGIDVLNNGVGQIATATEEMSATTNEITCGINQISDVTRESFSSFREVAEAATTLSSLAHQLEKNVQRFTV